MLYRWHTVQPEREIHRTPEPIVYNDDDILWKNPQHRERLNRFIGHLKAQRFRPDDTAKELANKYYIMYEEKPRQEDGLVALFVKTATWGELFGCSYGFDGWQDQPTTNDALLDCKGRSFEIFDNMYRGDYGAGVGGRDPYNNWGLIQQASKRDSSIIAREVWVCCGLPREHPGCWIGTEQHKIVPYDICPGFGNEVWRHVANGDRENITKLWNTPPRQGTMWKDVPKYDEIHKQILFYKNALTNSIINSLIALSEDDGWLGLILTDEIEDDLKQLINLQNEYNEIQCGVPPMTLDTFFNTALGATIMSNEDNRIRYQGVRLLQRKDTPGELHDDLQRFFREYENQKNLGFMFDDKGASNAYLDLLERLKDPLVAQFQRYAKNYDAHLKDNDMLGMKTEKSPLTILYELYPDFIKTYNETWDFAKTFRQEFNQIVRRKAKYDGKIQTQFDRFNKVFFKISSRDRYFNLLDMWMNVAYIDNIKAPFGVFTTKVEDEYTRRNYYQRVLTLYKQHKFYELTNQKMLPLFEAKYKKEEAILTAHYLANPQNYDAKIKTIEDYYKNVAPQVSAVGGIKLQFDRFQALLSNENADNVLKDQIKRQLMYIASLDALVYAPDEAKLIIQKLTDDVDLLEYMIEKKKINAGIKKGTYDLNKFVDMYWKYYNIDVNLKSNLNDRLKEKITKHELFVNFITSHNDYPEQTKQDVDKLRLEIENALKKLSSKNDRDFLSEFTDFKDSFDYFVEKYVQPNDKDLFADNKFSRADFPDLYAKAQFDFIKAIVTKEDEKIIEATKVTLNNEYVEFIGSKNDDLEDLEKWFKLGRQGDNEFFQQSAAKLKKIKDAVKLTDDEIELLTDLKFLLPDKFTHASNFNVRNTLVYSEDVGFFVKDTTTLPAYINVLSSYLELDINNFVESVLSEQSTIDGLGNFFNTNPQIIYIDVGIKEVVEITDKTILTDGADKESLVAKNVKIWENDSCWMDASFTTLFSIPGNSVIETIVGATQIYSEVYTLTFRNGTTQNIQKIKCEEKNAKTIHEAIVGDILDIQSGKTEKQSVCISRQFWREAYGCLTNATPEPRFDKFNDYEYAIQSLVNLYNLNGSVLTFKHTLDAIFGVTVDPEQHVTFISGTNDPTPVLALDMGKPQIEVKGRTISQDYRKYGELNVSPNTANYQLAAIIAFMPGHFTSYVYDFHPSKRAWTYLNADTQNRNRAFTRGLQGVRDNMELNKEVPRCFIYYSNEEVDRIVAKKEANTLDIPSDTVFEKYRLNPTFQKLFREDKGSYKNATQKARSIIASNGTVEPEDDIRKSFQQMFDSNN
jgi:hypothetical protein